MLTFAGNTSRALVRFCDLALSRIKFTIVSVQWCSCGIDAAAFKLLLCRRPVGTDFDPSILEKIVELQDSIEVVNVD